MAIKQHTIEDFDRQPTSSVEKLVSQQKKKKENISFLKYKNKIFIFAILVGFAIVFLLYYYNDNSKVKAISVKNNYYLSDNYIRGLSKINLDTRYYLVLDNLIEKNIKKDPMIDSVEVHHKSNNIILIDVKEKIPYGYRLDDVTKLLMLDGSAIDLTSEYMNVISKIPYIVGFKSEQQEHLLSKAFKEVDVDVIESISQVEQYALSYDENALLLTMNDSNYFICSYYGLNLVNLYNEVSSKLNKTGVCLFGDENASVIYESVCPWDQVKQTVEYWYDELGNPIYNEYGDHAVKHYYKDENGEFILDEKGNKIVIPLDENGREIEGLPPEEEEEIKE